MGACAGKKAAPEDDEVIIVPDEEIAEAKQKNKAGKKKKVVETPEEKKEREKAEKKAAKKAAKWEEEFQDLTKHLSYDARQMMRVELRCQEMKAAGVNPNGSSGFRSLEKWAKDFKPKPINMRYILQYYTEAGLKADMFGY